VLYFTSLFDFIGEKFTGQVNQPITATVKWCSKIGVDFFRVGITINEATNQNILFKKIPTRSSHKDVVKF